MKPLDVKFSESAKLELSDLSEAIDIDKSKIARAALYEGLKKLKLVASKDVGSALEMVLINDAKAKL